MYFIVFVVDWTMYNFYLPQFLYIDFHDLIFPQLIIFQIMFTSLPRHRADGRPRRTQKTEQHRSDTRSPDRVLVYQWSEVRSAKKTWIRARDINLICTYVCLPKLRKCLSPLCSSWPDIFPPTKGAFTATPCVVSKGAR